MVGTVIDHFRLVERIGSGGMGTVYKAVDLLLEREVALKFLRPELARQPELVERFRAEAVILSRLAHPHIASLHGLHRHDAELFMVMEFVPGETLQTRLARAGPVPPREAARLAARVLDALDHAHRQGVVHRDIKTANIIVTPDGTPKVMDFGIARLLGSDRRTRLGLTVGTPAYMSPEQIQGLDVDGRSDLYSLGVVLYEMLAGRVPFEADSDSVLVQAHLFSSPPPIAGRAALPPGLEQVVMRALEKTPDRRHATAVQFRLDLETVVPGLLDDARRPTPSLVVAPTFAAAAADSESSRVGGSVCRPRTAVAAGGGFEATSRGEPSRGGRTNEAWRERLRSAAIAASITIALLAGWRTWHAGPAAPDGRGVLPPGAGPTASKANAVPPASGSRPGGVPFLAASPRAPAGPQAAGAAAPRPAGPREPAAPGGSAPQRGGQDRAGPGQDAPPMWPHLAFEGTRRSAPAAGADASAPPAASPASASQGAAAPPSGSLHTGPAAGAPTGATPEADVAPHQPQTAEAASDTARKAMTASLEPPTTSSPPASPTRLRPAASPVSFDRIWLLEASGSEVREIGVVLELAGDRLDVLDKATREPRRTLAYRAISDMIYARSKHPRWKAGAGAAVAVGVFAAPVFFMKNTKHWLTLQGAGEAIVLRLDKDNYRLVLPALEARTGRPVEVAVER